MKGPTARQFALFPSPPTAGPLGRRRISINDLARWARLGKRMGRWPETAYFFPHELSLLTHLSCLFAHELQLLNSRMALILRRQAVDQL
jgi:hypothetical protein